MRSCEGLTAWGPKGSKPVMRTSASMGAHYQDLGGAAPAAPAAWTAALVVVWPAPAEYSPVPRPDGAGGWVPAAYVPDARKGPVSVETGPSGLVAGTGFEPATSGVCEQQE